MKDKHLETPSWVLAFLLDLQPVYLVYLDVLAQTYCSIDHYCLFFYVKGRILKEHLIILCIFNFGVSPKLMVVLYIFKIA